MYIKIRGRIHGPMTESQIKQMIQQGKAGKHNEVSTDGKTWSRASDFPELFPQKIQVHQQNDDDLQLADEPVKASRRGAGAGAAIWYLSNDGVTGLGPYSVRDILTLLAEGKTTREALVWIEGATPRQIKNVPEFSIEEKTSSAISAGSGGNSPGSPCSNCQKTILAEAAFCPHCGAAQGEKGANPLLHQRRCKSCGFPQEQGATFCPKCGIEQSAFTGKPKSRLVYILLALLFGGMFGIHNFYAKRKKQAMYQLILGLTLVGALVAIVWAIIEAFTVTSDGNGVPFSD